MKTVSPCTRFDCRLARDSIAAERSTKNEKKSRFESSLTGAAFVCAWSTVCRVLRDPVHIEPGARSLCRCHFFVDAIAFFRDSRSVGPPSRSAPARRHTQHASRVAGCWHTSHNARTHTHRATHKTRSRKRSVVARCRSVGRRWSSLGVASQLSSVVVGCRLVVVGCSLRSRSSLSLSAPCPHLAALLALLHASPHSMLITSLLLH